MSAPHTISRVLRPRLAVTLLTVVGFACSAATAAAQVSFSHQTLAGQFAKSTVSGDFDRNGRPGVVVEGASTTSSSNIEIPLEFEANAGQFPAEVKFAARAKGYQMMFTRSGPAFVFQRSAPAKASGEKRWIGNVVRMNFAGVDRTPEAYERTEGVSNYFIGNDSKKWHRGVPHYRRIVYKDAYPGIDIVFYTDGSGVEYDVDAAPGADLSQLRLKVEGADAVKIAADGGLSVTTALGTLHQRVAKVYQEESGKRRELHARFAQLEDGGIGLVVPGRDLRASLVVDPVLGYSTLLGGSSFDTAAAIAVDAAGHAYVAGGTFSSDFPVTAGAFDTTCASDCGKAFVTKLNTSGSGIIYSTFLGGTGSRGDGATGIAIDASGNAYVTGLAASPDFPGMFISATRSQLENVFATKLSPNGSSLIYSALFGGSNANGESTIAVDSAGDAYVGGNSQSPDFPTTPGAFQPTAAGDWHPFLAKINPAGTKFVFSTRLGGTNATDFSHSVAVDSSGNAFLVGEAHSSNFPTTPGVIKRTKTAASQAGFIARFSAQGTLKYSTLFGDGSVFSVALDSADDAFVTGGASNIPVTAGAFRKTAKGGDAFVAKINPSGTTTLYGTFLGGSAGDLGAGIAVNSAGQAFVFGETFSTDFPLTADAFEEITLGNHCGDTSSSACPAGFITKLNATGTGLLYSSYFGALAGVFVNDGSSAPGQIIGLDAKGNAYVTGFTGSLNFPTTNTALKQKLLAGPNDRQDGFVSKITPLCTLKAAIPSVTVCSPASSATVHSPVTVIAGTHSTRRVKVLQVYADGKKKYQANLSAVEVKLALSAGKHRITVQGIDTANTTFKTSVSITVSR